MVEIIEKLQDLKCRIFKSCKICSNIQITGNIANTFLPAVINFEIFVSPSRVLVPYKMPNMVRDIPGSC